MGNFTSKNIYNIVLYGTVIMTGDLFKLRDSITKCMVFNEGLQERKMKVDFCISDNFNAPLDVIVQSKTMEVMEGLDVKE